MAIGGIHIPASGMQANRLRVDVSANNVANINTDGFRASTVQTTDAAYSNNIGQGTKVSGVYTPPTPSPMAAVGAADGRGGMTILSNTDAATEITGQMTAEKAYAVNVSVVRTMDDMLGTLLDIKR